VSSIPTGARLFAAALLVYIVCPPFLSYDSYYTVPAALGLLRHGSLAVDDFVAGAPIAADYTLVCVPPGGPELRGVRDCGGHRYNYFSPGVSVLAVPVVAAIQVATRVVATVHPTPVTTRPEIAAFFAGDLVGGRPLTELPCASFFGALAVWLQFAIARRFLAVRESVAYALLFAFGTSEWSIASRNLTQHGLTILLLSAAIYCAVRAFDEPRWIAWSAVPLALGVTVRPSNAIAAGVFTVYVLVAYRREFWRFAACAAPVAAIFFAHNLIALHALLPVYYRVNSPDPYPPLAGLAMNLFSPARGIFVFTPVFLFALAGLRGRWLFLGAILALHTALISRYWGGHSYGPRYFSDMTPVFCFLLIPAYLRWKKRPRRSLAAAFAVLALWGVFVHGHGATSIAANQWSALPVNIDDAKWRVWDWHDPQFFRGLR
jgi:hypothetical protein